MCQMLENVKMLKDSKKIHLPTPAPKLFLQGGWGLEISFRGGGGGGGKKIRHFNPSPKYHPP